MFALLCFVCAIDAWFKHVLNVGHICKFVVKHKAITNSFFFLLSFFVCVCVCENTIPFECKKTFFFLWHLFGQGHTHWFHLIWVQRLHELCVCRGVIREDHRKTRKKIKNLRQLTFEILTAGINMPQLSLQSKYLRLIFCFVIWLITVKVPFISPSFVHCMYFILFCFVFYFIFGCVLQNPPKKKSTDKQWFSQKKRVLFFLFFLKHTHTHTHKKERTAALRGSVSSIPAYKSVMWHSLSTSAVWGDGLLHLYDMFGLGLHAMHLYIQNIVPTCEIQNHIICVCGFVCLWVVGWFACSLCVS